MYFPALHVCHTDFNQICNSTLYNLHALLLLAI